MNLLAAPEEEGEEEEEGRRGRGRGGRERGGREKGGHVVINNLIKIYILHI